MTVTAALVVRAREDVEIAAGIRPPQRKTDRSTRSELVRYALDNDLVE